MRAAGSTWPTVTTRVGRRPTVSSRASSHRPSWTRTSSTATWRSPTPPSQVGYMVTYTTKPGRQTISIATWRSPTPPSQVGYMEVTYTTKSGRLTVSTATWRSPTPPSQVGYMEVTYTTKSGRLHGGHLHHQVR